MKGKTMDLKLCDSDYKFMTIVWEHAPINSGELVALCNEQLGWKKSTTYTMLKKLCEKGIFKNEHAVVSAQISREEFYGRQSREFVEDTFDGSLPKFLTAFIGKKKLSDAQVEEMKALIENYRES